MPRPSPQTSRRSSHRPSKRPSGPSGPGAEYETEALDGLEAVAQEELKQVPGVRDQRGSRFWFPGDPTRLTRLRGSVAVYRIKTFDVPRPKALLGHQQLGELSAFLLPVIAYGGHGSFRLSAAGRESSTMRRLAEELETSLGIPHLPDEGELLIRLRPTENPNRQVVAPPPGQREEERRAPSPHGERNSRANYQGGGRGAARTGAPPRWLRDADPAPTESWDEEEQEAAPEAPFEEGWDVLARLTPRPLSARAWRACNMAGGLNATIAYAIFKLAGVREADRIFNPMSGSGTLLIERDLLGPSAALVGVDNDPAAVRCAQQNIQAAGRQIEVAEVDALNTGLPPRSFELIVADLPWGDAITVPGGNEALYTAFLREMHRLCSRQGRLVVLTHELKLFERLIAEQDRWHAHELFQVYSGGHHPKAYLLSRN
ncbi:methyltransferase domain-containing protein [Deinococcus sp.]|uniref:methyltransferase domain-containing protein n=1 Tax=Deinococcus sp. TaxID=47478 RepID=UPI0025CC4DE2|nr:methyltransferase domain-containing protein [Deinococcus sp.]